ncbi:pseudaminic acid synthase [Sciscionella sediminilitoris]|uniref:pseudaminic acid synthase n=1 Tax=Sciscionella sediminilitoris TaxID=1445613 RepID=UPI00068AC720|nr:pseudaminic acid synthase [Sciscionella sp. SE31]
MGARSYGDQQVRIGSREVGPGRPTYVIAEAGANHNRDLDTALRLIDVAAESGADAVKFQTYTAEGLYSRKTPTMSYLTDADLLENQESVFEMIKRVEIPWEWHDELAEHASRAGIDFLSTPFEEKAVDLLERLDIPAYKIASYEVNHLPLIERCAATGKPLIISTGMASLTDIERALDTANAAGASQIVLLHCAVNYPPRFEDLNLRAIGTLASAFGIPIGWSDHTMGHTADVVAVALGACVVEKHYTLSRDQDGPDHPFALEPDELTSMVTAIREAEDSLGSSVKRVTEAEHELFRLGRRSLVAAGAIAAGKPLARADIAVKRPGYGIAVHELDRLVGKVASRDIEADEILTWDLFA